MVKCNAYIKTRVLLDLPVWVVKGLTLSVPEMLSSQCSIIYIMLIYYAFLTVWVATYGLHQEISMWIVNRLI